MSITIGWWAIPTIITVVIWAWAMHTPAGYHGYAHDPTPLIWGGIAMIVTLFAWMVYGLAT